MLENSCQRLHGPGMAVLRLAPGDLQLLGFGQFPLTLTSATSRKEAVPERNAPGSLDARENLVDHLQSNHHGKAHQKQLGGCREGKDCQEHRQFAHCLNLSHSDSVCASRLWQEHRESCKKFQLDTLNEHTVSLKRADCVSLAV